MFINFYNSFITFASLIHFIQGVCKGYCFRYKIKKPLCILAEYLGRNLMDLKSIVLCQQLQMNPREHNDIFPRNHAYSFEALIWTCEQGLIMKYNFAGRRN